MLFRFRVRISGSDRFRDSLSDRSVFGRALTKSWAFGLPSVGEVFLTRAGLVYAPTLQLQVGRMQSAAGCIKKYLTCNSAL
jgi:hypothetical protein